MEQFGTPEDVYLRPASTFVAGFIGSPPMNLVEGEADGATFTAGGERINLPQPAPRNGKLILGMRPEHADIVASDPKGWQLRVEVVEMLGAERLIYGRLCGELFTVRLEGTMTPPRIGDTVTLAEKPEHLHWFDATTRQRIAS